MLSVFLVMVVLAVIIERVIEIIKEKIAPAKLPNWAWFVITAALGIALCFGFGIDMLAAMGFTGTAFAVIISYVLTGISIGAGSGFVHSLNTKLNESRQFMDDAEQIELRMGEDAEDSDDDG